MVGKIKVKKRERYSQMSLLHEIHLSNEKPTTKILFEWTKHFL